MPGERAEREAEGLARARRLGHAAKPARIEAQRELLTEAMVEAAAAKGHEACRVDDVLARSGLSRSTFYKHFADKEECFLAAFETAVDALLAAVREAIADQVKPEARFEAGLDALLARLAGNPAIAQLALVEIRTIGSQGQEHYEAASRRFATLLDAGNCLGDGDAGLEARRAEWAVSTVATVLWLEVGCGRTENLQRLAPALVSAIQTLIRHGGRTAPADTQ